MRIRHETWILHEWASGICCYYYYNVPFWHDPATSIISIGWGARLHGNIPIPLVSPLNITGHYIIFAMCEGGVFKKLDTCDRFYHTVRTSVPEDIDTAGCINDKITSEESLGDGNHGIYSRSSRKSSHCVVRLTRWAGGTRSQCVWLCFKSSCDCLLKFMISIPSDSSVTNELKNTWSHIPHSSF